MSVRTSVISSALAVLAGTAVLLPTGAAVAKPKPLPDACTVLLNKSHVDRVLGPTISITPSELPSASNCLYTGSGNASLSISRATKSVKKFKAQIKNTGFKPLPNVGVAAGVRSDSRDPEHTFVIAMSKGFTFSLVVGIPDATTEDDQIAKALAKVVAKKV